MHYPRDGYVARQLQSLVCRMRRTASFFNGKTSKSIFTSSQAFWFTLLLSLFIFIPNAQAGPAGGNVAGGAGSINQSYSIGDATLFRMFHLYLLNA